jgi:hypothetical protein
MMTRCARCKIDFSKHPLEACEMCPSCVAADKAADRVRFWWRYPQPEWETKTFINAGHPLSLVAKPQFLLDPKVWNFPDLDQRVWDFQDGVLEVRKNDGY